MCPPFRLHACRHNAFKIIDAVVLPVHPTRTAPAATLCGILAATIAVASAVDTLPLYLGFYDGLTVDTAPSCNLELASTPADAVSARGLASHRIDALLSVRGTFFLGPGLHPDWQSRWAALRPIGQELLSNGTIIGFNLGDELVWNCIPSQNVSSVAAAVRADFPRGSAIIWYNEVRLPPPPPSVSLVHFPFVISISHGDSKKVFVLPWRPQ